MARVVPFVGCYFALGVLVCFVSFGWILHLCAPPVYIHTHTHTVTLIFPLFEENAVDCRVWVVCIGFQGYNNVGSNDRCGSCGGIVCSSRLLRATYSSASDHILS